MTTAAKCDESCRISWPSSLIGDYQRGIFYDDLRLVSWYPNLFSSQDTVGTIITVPWVEGYDHFINLLISQGINATATVWSRSVSLQNAMYLTLMIQATSVSSTPNLQVSWEGGVERPATEYVTDSGYFLADDMINIYDALTSETWNIKQFNAAPSPFGRLKVVGNTGNPADVIVNAKLFMRSREP